MAKKDEIMEEGEDLTLLTRLLDDENDENIILFDENGDEVELEQVGMVPYNRELYAILRPIDADEDSAAVFRVDTEDEESLTAVEDDALATKILDLYNATIQG
ncbi:MAG: DUF1292 domain-containing protein [Firmicutes bacterium]|nr:DUF1292 domain-containing protein [Bacillota bacterium]